MTLPVMILYLILDLPLLLGIRAKVSLCLLIVLYRVEICYAAVSLFLRVLSGLLASRIRRL